MPKYSGATVEIAIQKALTNLAVTRQQVTVNIIEEGKKGFLGIGKKEALVEVTVNSEVEMASDSVQKATENNKAQMKSKQKNESIQKEQQKPTESSDVNESILEKSTSSTEDKIIETATKNTEEMVELTDLDDETAIKQLALYLTNITKEMNAPALVRIERIDQEIIFHLDTDRQGMLIGKHGKVLNALQYIAQVFIHRTAKNKLSVMVNVGNYREKRQDILQRLAERTADKVERTGSPVFLEPMSAYERKQIHAALADRPTVKTHSEGNDPYRYLVVEPSKHLI